MCGKVFYLRSRNKAPWKSDTWEVPLWILFYRNYPCPFKQIRFCRLSLKMDGICHEIP